ncbi:hypothetical protein PRLR6025_22640 [Prevotella lacticifex]|uniref:glycosyltransferase family 2 protein n=1 Tax=Prevotella lacticifex TaxID=2854755 RepID=UPI001CC77ED1|nr:glycosyltransferase family 2 protein [Prevotella lacticifex]GJG68795.1 hypothetical protein PRLR6025_22640 [Prevotella lacticifex]
MESYNDVKVSIIVPVYNAGELLRPCLASLTGQTLRDIEIILVTDCPTDGSDKVCEEFAAKDSRIKIIRNDHNLHIGESRNHGLKIARGEYVGFSDDDDYQEPYMYEHLYRKAKANDYDMVVSMDTHVEQGRAFTMDIPKEADVNPRDYLLRDLLSEGAERHDFPLCTNIHPHLYKRSIIEQNSLVFGDTRKITAEDRMWNIQFFLKSRNIGILREQLYYHRNNPNSEGLRKGSGYRTEGKVMAYLLDIYNLLKEEQALNNFGHDFLIGAMSELMNMLGYSLTMDKNLSKFLRLRKDVRRLPFGRDAIKVWTRPDWNPSSIVRSVIKLTI